MKLIDMRRVQWQNRAHFFGVSAQLMRRDELEHTAYHEAGHAVARHVHGFQPTLSTIRPDGDMLGRTDSSLWYDRKSARNFLVCLCAGYAGDVHFSPADKQKAYAAAGHDWLKVQDVLTSAGITAPQEYWIQKAHDVISKHWPEVEAVAKELLARTEIDGEEILHIVEWGRTGKDEYRQVLELYRTFKGDALGGTYPIKNDGRRA